MNTTKKKMNIGNLMLIVLACALVVGIGMMFLKSALINGGHENIWNGISWLLFDDISTASGNSSIGLFYIVQTLFVNGLQLAIVPLVLTAISLGLCAISDTAKFGRVAIKTVLGFLFFYVFGCLFAIIASVISINTGWFNVDMSALVGGELGAVTEYVVSNPLNIILKFVPSNIMSTWIVNNQILAVVFVAVVLGICMNLLGDKVADFKKIVEQLSDIVNMYLDFLVNKCGPICIFCMVVRTLALYGWEQISSLLHYMMVAAIVLLFYWIICYPLLISITCKVKPLPFLKKSFKAGLFAFSVNSSGATMPLSRKVCIEELGCDEAITDFVIPTGATVNMNGTAIEHVIAVAFMATVCGMDVSLMAYITIMLLAIGSAAGTPTVPNAGTVMIYATLTGAGFGTELSLMIYMLLLSLNKPIDMLVTALNVVGDCATSTLVSNSEGQLDKELYHS